MAIANEQKYKWKCQIEQRYKSLVWGGMPVTFVHLSDIHFGQEKGSKIIVHDDVKARLIEDAADLVKKHAGGRATGIIVTGDTAYAGKRDEYLDAAKWLDRLASAVDCPKTAVQVVPGNHSIARFFMGDLPPTGHSRKDMIVP
jgi:hypothetical protein